MVIVENGLGISVPIAQIFNGSEDASGVINARTWLAIRSFRICQSIHSMNAHCEWVVQISRDA